jgi:hypothetical protein
MQRINFRRVLQAGLVAGLVISISEYVLNEIVLREDIAAILSARRLSPIRREAIAAFVALAFILGLVLVWLYAAIYPRFGIGAKSKIIAAALVWFLAYFWSTAFYSVLGLFPPQVFFISLAWGFIELSIAAIIAGKIYSKT